MPFTSDAVPSHHGLVSHSAQCVVGWAVPPIASVVHVGTCLCGCVAENKDTTDLVEMIAFCCLGSGATAKWLPWLVRADMSWHMHLPVIVAQQM